MNAVEISQPEFGLRLRRLRKELGLSQKAVAGDRLTPSYISLLENGNRVPTFDVTIQLARILGTSLEDLIGYKVDGLLGEASEGDAALNASRVQARHLAEMGDAQGARALLRTEFEALGPQAAERPRLEVGIELASVLASTGHHEERVKVLDELLSTRSVGDAPLLRRSLRIDRASSLRELGRLRESRLELEELRRSDEGAPPPERVRLLGVLASVQCEMGDYEEAAATIAEMIPLAEDRCNSATTGRAHWVASMVCSRMGRPVDAERHLRAARSLLTFESMPLRDWMRFCRINASVMLDIGAELDEAHEWIQIAETTARLTGSAAAAGAATRERARYEQAKGRHERAAELYSSLLSDDLTGESLLVTLLGLGATLPELDRTPEAIEALREAARYCERNGNYRMATEIWNRIDRLRQTV